MNQRQILANLLRNCSKKSSLDEGLKIHGLVLRMGYEYDLILTNNLIDMYGKCGKTHFAYYVFDKMTDRNVVSWTALMCAYLQNNNVVKCLSIFQRMGDSDSRPNEFTLSTAVKAAGITNDAVIGSQIRGFCSKTSFERVVVVGNSIVNMNANCERFGVAMKMFEAMTVRSLVTWNVMIAKFTDTGNGKQALPLFQEIQRRGEVPDEFSFSSTLKACSIIDVFRQGKQIHSSMITRGFLGKYGVAVVGAFIDMYVKCRRLVEARRVFDQTKQKNVISWSALILGYAQEGNLEEAVNLFRRLRESGHDEIDGLLFQV